MLANVSRNERIVSITLGSVVLLRGLFSGKKSTLGRVTQSATGAGMLWRGLSGYCPLYEKIGRQSLSELAASRSMEKSITIHKPIEEVRDVLGEGDPVWYASSSKIFPITAGDLLWDLRLEEISSGRQTLVRATLSDQNSTFGLKSRLHGMALKKAADAELRKLKALVETGEIPTIKGQPHGLRRSAQHTVEVIAASIEYESPRDFPQAIPSAEVTP